MNKNILYLILLSLLISACEKDDICLSPTTPKLIVRFYDNADQTVKKDVVNLSIWADGKDTLSTFKSVTLDSIYIPLNTNTTQTIYNLKTSATGNKADNKINKLTINYTTEDIFVSRSCGFKTIFKTVTISSDNGWFQSFTPNSITTIDNENTAHIKVYH